MKQALIAIAILLPCAIVVLFLKLEFPSAMIVTFALIAVLFFASLPWTAGFLYDHWRMRDERPQGGTVVKAFEDDPARPEPPSTPP